MVKYTVCVYDKNKIVKKTTTDEGLEWARHIAYFFVRYGINASPIDYTEIMDENGKSVGYVFSDRAQHRSYRSLGIVYCPYKGDQALHLVYSGKTSKFTHDIT